MGERITMKPEYTQEDIKKITPIDVILTILRDVWGKPYTDRRGRQKASTVLHTVYSGLNETLRKIGVDNPIAYQEELVASGDFFCRTWTGGALLGLTDAGMKRYGFTLPVNATKTKANKRVDDVISRIILRKASDSKKA
jgi:hypothetical protein